MKIELKNIKHAEFASQETNCFEAVVYIDGKRAAVVSNEGHGGGDNWSDRAVARRIDEFAQTLPPYVCSWNDPATGRPMEMTMSAELLIGGLLEEHLAARAEKREVAKLAKKLQQKTLFIGEDGQCWSHAGPRRSRPYPGVVLNDLPLEKAFALLVALPPPTVPPSEPGRKKSIKP